MARTRSYFSQYKQKKQDWGHLAPLLEEGPGLCHEACACNSKVTVGQQPTATSLLPPSVFEAQRTLGLWGAKPWRLMAASLQQDLQIQSQTNLALAARLTPGA